MVREGLPGVYPRLWRYALALTARRDWADDLAQKTCLRALEKAALFDPATHLDRWVFRMAQRLWLNELRADRVRKGAGLVPVDEVDLPSGAPGVETNILAAEVLTRVRTLPEAQRAAVVLVYVEGYRYAEAAEILEVPVGTIMSRLSAARSKLADLAEDRARATEQQGTRS